MGDEEVKLLSFWGSMFGTRIMIALDEKGIEYEYIEEDFSKSVTKSALLLQMNPVHKCVPVLIHKGKPICESLVALEYIEETWKHKAPSLLPSDPHQKAVARFWANYVDKVMYENGEIIWRKKGKEHEEGKKRFIESLKTLEQQLGEKTYFGGENFGFVDVALVPFYPWFYTYETLGKLRIEKECPKLIAWAKRCMERESVSRAAFPDGHKLYEFVLLRRKRLGID